MNVVRSPETERALPVPTTKRTRKRAPKSRQGCSRCKSRRVKCDENRPACRNCSRLGCQCPGFQPELRWSKKHERLHKTVLIDANPGQPQDYGHHVSENQRTEAERTSAASQATAFPSALNTSRGGLDCLDPLAAVDADPYSLPALPTIYPAATLDSDALLDDSTGWDMENARGASGVSKLNHSLTVTPGPGALQTPAHLPTMLIEHWFRYICPMWSTFDSEVSYNRQLAWSSWSTCKAVFYTMQAMSAACLLDTTPQLRETLPSLRLQAAAAIDEGISQVRRSQPPRVTSNLVYAVFTLGNSLHWTTSSLSEHPWLEFARELLSIWKMELSAPDASLHAYFCQALAYWEMLLAATGRGSTPAKLETKRRQYQARLRQAIHLPDDDSGGVFYEPLPSNPGQNLLGTRPNSWCGVSNEVIDTFGQVLALCRNACHHHKSRDALTAEMTSKALCDISLAHELQKELLAMDFGALVHMEEVQGFPVQTRDDNTPVSHLLQTAEAYRQAALLQLHLTFSDLAMTPPGKCCGFTETLPDGGTDDITMEGEQPRAEFLLSLALRVVTTLEQIPAKSGTRSIHLMLYLSAAAGLRFDACPKSHHGLHTAGEQESIDLLTDPVLEPSTSQADQFLHATAQPAFALPEHVHYQHTLDLAHAADPFTPGPTLDVSRARRLVLKRLSSLQQTLPHRRTDGTTKFVKAMWRACDGLQSRCSSITHWLDIMSEAGSEITLW